MLERISWGNYFFVIAIAAVIYYLVIILLYYRSDITDILTKRVKNEKESDDEPTALQSNEVQDLEDIVIKIKGILVESGAQVSKDELLANLGQTLMNYNGLQKPAFRVALNNYIIKQAKELCGVGFSEEELEKEWMNPHR